MSDVTTFLKMLPLCGLASCRIDPTPEAVNMAVAQWNCVRLGAKKIACSKNGAEPTIFHSPVSLVGVATPWQGMPCLLDDSGDILCAQDEHLSVFSRVSLPNIRYKRIIAGREGVYAQSGNRDFTFWWFDPKSARYSYIFHSLRAIEESDALVYAYEYGQDAVFASEDASRGSHIILQSGAAADHLSVQSIDIGIADPILQQADWRLGAALSHVCRANGYDSVMCEAAKASVNFASKEAVGSIVKVDLGLHHGCWLSGHGIASCFGELTADDYIMCKLASVDDVAIGRLNSCFSFADGSFRCWSHKNGDGLRLLCESALPGDRIQEKDPAGESS